MSSEKNHQSILSKSSLKRYVRKSFFKDYVKYIPKTKWRTSIPTKKSFLWVLFLVLASVILSFFLYQIDANILKKVFSIEHQDLLNIHIGIGAVLVGMAFFVANSLVDIDSGKGRVLLHNSNFFGLISAEILTLFIFLLLDDKFSIISVIAIGLCTIYYLGKTIRILILDYEMENSKKNMLIDILNNYLTEIFKQDIYKRQGNSILSKEGIKYKDISRGVVDFNPLGAYYYDNFVYYKVHKDGFINDISLKKLNNFIQVLIDNINPDYLQEMGDKEKSPVVYFAPKFYEYSNGKVLAIKKDSISNDNINKLIGLAEKIFCIEDNRLIRLAKNIFRIKNNKYLNIEKEARFEVTKIKNRCIEAIRNENEDALEKGADLYIEIIKNFYNNIKSFGGGFSSEQAQNERNAFPFEQLKYTEWISSDIKQLFERGILSDRINILSLIIKLPGKLAIEAINNNDHLVFQEYTSYYELLYHRAAQNKIKEIYKIKAIDDAAKYLNHIADRYLSYRYRDNNIEEKDLMEYAEFLLRIFQNLVKACIDYNDFESFKKYVKKTASSFKVLNYSPHRIPRQKEVYKNIADKKEEVYLGLSAWVLYKLINDVQNKDYLKYYNILIEYLPNKINDLAKIFLRTIDQNIGHFWGWHSWELDDKYHEDGGMVSILFDEYLNYIFIIKSLILIKDLDEESILGIKLPNDKNFASLIGKDIGLTKSLKNLKDDDKFSNIITDELLCKISIFNKKLELARMEFEEYQKELIRENSISEEKIAEFKRGVINNYKNSSNIREIFKYYELFEYENKKTGGKSFGINKFFDKRAFIDNKNIKDIYFDLSEGFNIGRAIVDGENIQALNILNEKFTSVEISKLDDILRSYGSLENTFIISLNSAHWEILDQRQV